MLRFIVSFTLPALLLFSCNEQPSKVHIYEYDVESPFGNFVVKTPDFSDVSSFNITEFGALKDDQLATTEAIALSIEKAAAAGGGKVIIPEGEWLTGKIHLKSNVDLHLERGAKLIFSDNPEDYLPPVHTTWEGLECYNYSPLIYAYNCQNVAITGAGELYAKMDHWKTWFGRPPGHMNSLKRLYELAVKDSLVEHRQMVNDSAHFRPQFIQFNRCENVLLEDITIRNSPFWVIHPYLSKDVTIRNVNVQAHGHNNDGVDPEMSQQVLIEDCLFDQGDDAIAVKSGRNQDAWRLNTPAKNIVIRNCKVLNGHQLLAIGSELSGGIENISISDCEVAPNAKLNHLLFIKTNERRGGYVKHIFMNNIKAGSIAAGILGIETDVLYQWRDLVPTYERRLTPISNVTMKDIKATNVDFISRVLGQEDLPVKDIQMVRISTDTVRSETPNIHEALENFKTE
ncbi:glycoside hydrolase family 28 protein [Robertkochia solimangrovi]|uniref:glycoside hydrolase family 28 protein n=1 Tax=Robertkochia solimangrovi TaxID=2213046 RepID=UPI00117CF8B1|nr:glycoside hydrolase family 28 protein [Robertkochia solimangrovi]TRZ45058.1 glycoside hydrolase family 28 protein [Robertkochia solimangrovi]